MLLRKAWPWGRDQKEKEKEASQGDGQSFGRVGARKKPGATSAMRSGTSNEIARSGRTRREIREDLMC